MRHKTNGQRYVTASDGSAWIVNSFATPREAPAAWDRTFDPFLTMPFFLMFRPHRRQSWSAPTAIMFLLSAYRPGGDVRWHWAVSDPALIDTLVGELKDGEVPENIRLEGTEPEIN